MIAARRRSSSRERQTFDGGEVSGADGAGITGGVGRVLHEALRQPADGRGAKTDQRVGVVGGVALEIAVQPAFARGDAEFVVGQGEMIEADRLIAEAR